VLRLPPPLAAAAYATLLPPLAVEFLPTNLLALLDHKLTLNAYLAIQRGDGGPDKDSARTLLFALLNV
jgi:hypothetical protein